MEKKVITINPALFKIGKSKTKKSSKPLVSPKMIKRTLINRIKERKKPSESGTKQAKIEPATETEKTKVDKFKETDTFFSQIIKNRERGEKSEKTEKSEKENEKIRKNTTIKTHNPLHNYNMEPIDKNVEKILFKPNGELSYKIDNDVPHGCLKNGVKPCFKTWKNYKHFAPPPPARRAPVKSYSEEEEVKNIVQSEINKAINGKTEFSTDLIEKYHNDSEENKPLRILEDVQLDSIVDISTQSEPLQMNQLQPAPLEPTPLQPAQLQPEILELYPDSHVAHVAHPEISIETNSPIEMEDVEVEVKRTIKRKYTLGKVGGKKDVGVLTKNKTSRKNISDYIKDFKKMTHEETKKYLQTCGLLKVGSVAPREIVRKLYENTMLAGEIVNTNSSVLLHNLINAAE
jgi:hypothetical protein